MDEKLVMECLRMLKERRDYWGKATQKGSAVANSCYSSAVLMLSYAIEGNSDCLRNFDYYGDDALLL